MHFRTAGICIISGVLLLCAYLKKISWLITGSCSAGPRQPVYRTPGAPPPPPPGHDSALAQLMQCEQRILHGAPHYRGAAPPGPWITHRHGPPPAQSFIPVSRHRDDLWHAHDGEWSCSSCLNLLKLRYCTM